MTDPVPYEPAENIPPLIVLADTTPEPYGSIEFDLTLHPTDAGTPLEQRLHIVVRDYNLDDTLYYKLVRKGCGSGSQDLGSDVLPPTGQRDRTLDLTLQYAELGGETCTKLVLAVSDRGWSPHTPPYCSPPNDDQGKPVTIVARAVWIVWVNDGTSPSGPALGACGVDF